MVDGRIPFRPEAMSELDFRLLTCKFQRILNLPVIASIPAFPGF